MTQPIVILSLSDLAERGIRYSRSQLWRLSKAKRFPRPVKLGENRIGFVASEVDAWLAARVAERDAEMEVA